MIMLLIYVVCLYLAIIIVSMQEDPRSNKELLLTVLEKCKATLPEVAVLMKRMQMSGLSGSGQKVKKKDCLNPKFLIQLSQCGQKIRNILLQTIENPQLCRQQLRSQYNRYMRVIMQIRRYHQEAHNSHDMHKNSTIMKENLLNQLKKQIQRRKQLQDQLQFLKNQFQRQSLGKDKKIQQLIKQLEGKKQKQNIDLSHTSNYSQRQQKYGQLYGGDSRIGQITEDQQLANQTRKLRKRILQLQQLLQQNEEKHQQQIDEQRQQIAQLQTQFQQFKKTQLQVLPPSLPQIDHERNQFIKSHCAQDFYRLLLLQATTIQEYLNENDT